MESKKRIPENPFAVSVKSKKIFSVRVTDDHVHDGKSVARIG